jgi:hypothetical protein
MNERTFAVVANILSSMPSQQHWDDRVSAVYAIAMKDWDDSLTQRAVMKCLMTKRWRPTPAEIREVALQLKRVHVPSHTAYEQVKHVVLYYPPHEREQAVDRLVKQGKVSPSIPLAIATLGGWRNVGHMTEDKLSNVIENAVVRAVEDPRIDDVLKTPLLELSSGGMKMIGE